MNRKYIKLSIFVAAFLLSLFFHTSNSTGKEIKPDTRAIKLSSPNGIVISNSGLILRSSPSTKASKITHLPPGAIITLHDPNGPEDTLHGITARWIKVFYSGKEGWAFGGFIKRLNYELLGAYKNADVEFFMYKNNKFEMQVNMCSGLAFIYGNYKIDKKIIKCLVMKIEGSGFMGDDIKEFHYTIIGDKTIEYGGTPVGCAPIPGYRLEKL
jgi:hypothetical protein